MLNFDKSIRLKEDEYKKIYGLLKKLKYDIEVINLNFCLNLSGKFSLRPKRLSTLINFSQFKSIREFHAIDFELTIDDFESLIKSTQLKSLSFTDSFITNLDVVNKKKHFLKYPFNYNIKTKKNIS